MGSQESSAEIWKQSHWKESFHRTVGQNKKPATETEFMENYDQDIFNRNEETVVYTDGSGHQDVDFSSG